MHGTHCQGRGLFDTFYSVLIRNCRTGTDAVVTLSIQLLLPCFSIAVHNPLKETELANSAEAPPFLLSRAYPTHIAQGLWEDSQLQLWWAVVLLELAVMMNLFRPLTCDSCLRLTLAFASLRCSGAHRPITEGYHLKTHRLKRRDAEQEQLNRRAPTNMTHILYSPNVPVKPKA